MKGGPAEDMGSGGGDGPDVVEEEGEEEVGDEDGHGGVEDGGGGAAADADCALADREALVAGHDDDDVAVGEAFGHAEDDIDVVDVFVELVIVEGFGDIVDPDGHETGGSDAEADAFADEEGYGEEHGDEARGDEVVDRVDAEGAEGVDLFGDLHGADFCGHGGTDAACEHEGGEDWAEFAAHGEGDDAADETVEAELVEFVVDLGCEDGAGGCAGDDDLDLGAEADGDELASDFGPADAAAEEGVEEFGGEDGESAEVADETQHEPAEP